MNRAILASGALLMGLCVTTTVMLTGAQSMSNTPTPVSELVARQKRVLREKHIASKQVEKFNGAFVAAGEIIIRFRRTPSKRFQSLLVDQISGAHQPSLREIGGGLNLYCLHVDGLSTSDLLQKFPTAFLGNSETSLKQNAVIYFEPNYLLELEQRNPNDLTMNGETLWALRDFARDGPGISAQSAWDMTTGSNGAVIGMVDSGIDASHPDLKNTLWRAPYDFRVKVGGQDVQCSKRSYGYNVRPDEGEAPCLPDDGPGHGTNVAGIIGAEGNNGKGIVGVNWKPQLLALRFTDRAGSGFACDAIDAIEFAVQLKTLYKKSKDERFNVRVLNNSYGYHCSSAVRCGLDSMEDMIKRANEAGIIFVTSAGNVGLDNGTSPHFPSGYFDLDNVISVASTNHNDKLSDSSNYGEHTVHLGAPGVDILTTWNWVDQKYRHQSGTSMAAAFVSGAAALVLSDPKCRFLKPSEIKKILITSVDPVKALQGKLITGGRLNVHRAIKTCGP